MPERIGYGRAATFGALGRGLRNIGSAIGQKRAREAEEAEYERLGGVASGLMRGETGADQLSEEDLGLFLRRGYNPTSFMPEQQAPVQGEIIETTEGYVRVTPTGTEKIGYEPPVKNPTWDPESDPVLMREAERRRRGWVPEGTTARPGDPEWWEIERGRARIGEAREVLDEISGEANFERPRFNEAVARARGWTLPQVEAELGMPPGSIGLGGARGDGRSPGAAAYYGPQSEPDPLGIESAIYPEMPAGAPPAVAPSGPAPTPAPGAGAPAATMGGERPTITQDQAEFLMQVRGWTPEQIQQTYIVR